MINWTCLALDEVFFRSYRKVDIKEPFFILGVPRSGSTLLYRLLAKDEHNFTSFKFWEIIFAPSVLQRKFWRFIGKIDKRIGQPLTRTVKRIDIWLFKSTKDIHQFGLFLEEEDGILLIWIFSTFFVFFAYPFLEQFQLFLKFDEQISEKDKKHIMQFYLRCVQRHLYFHGPHKRLLSKNPTFASMVQTLLQTFPDARFLNTVRIPYQQIPSLLSFMVFFVSRFGGDFLKIPDYKNVVLNVINVFYQNPISSLKKMDDDRYAFILFEDLVKDLEKTVCGQYEKFGMRITEDFESIIKAKVFSSKKHESKHKYSLEQFDLTLDEIWTCYRTIFDEFGFPHQSVSGSRLHS